MVIVSITTTTRRIVGHQHHSSSRGRVVERVILTAFARPAVAVGGSNQQQSCCRTSSRRWLSNKYSSESTDADAATIAAREKLLRASYQKAQPPGGLFPWRHDERPLDRLIPGTTDFDEKGQLLGGNVISSNPALDAYVTAYMFLGVPLYKMPFFSHYQADLAESMAWAFTQAMSGMLSNVYHVPCGDNDSESLNFTHPLAVSETGDESSSSSEDEDETTTLDEVNYMMQSRLRSLYHSAHVSGKDQIQIRLESKPLHSEVVSLFVFPFLSRNQLKRDPSLKERYLRFLVLVTESPQDALPLFHEMMIEFEKYETMESTVICQVMVACDEIFWVKDLSTGTILQGQEEGSRRVWHLVRMEMVVEAKRSKRTLFPFRLVQGNWQVTDIDDMLGGNLIL